MAAPDVTPGTPFATETAAANHTITLDAGTLYKAVLVSSLSAAAHTITGPTGWTATEIAAISSSRKLTLVASDDPTSATSVQIDCNSSNAEVAVIPFTTDGDMDNRVVPTGVASSGTTPDPPSTGTISSGDYRIIAIAGFMDARRDITGYPTNYADDQTATKAGTSNNSPGIGMATRGLTSITSEDPGTFTLNGSIAWTAGTIAIPAAAGGTPATVTPATIATSSTVPTPTPTGEATASPAAIATTSSVPGPSPTAPAATTPGAVGTSSALDTPTITIGKTVTPDEIATVTVIPTPTPQGLAVVAMSTPIVTTSALDTPTVITDAPTTVTPDEIVTTSSVPAPTPTGAAAVAPVTIVTSITLPTPTPSVPGTVSPATVVTVTALATPTPVGDVKVSPATIATLVQLWAPLIGLEELDITSIGLIQFHRIGNLLVYSPIGRGTRLGFQTSEGYERVSDVVRVDNLRGSQASAEQAMVAVSSAWAANSGASAAVLKAAIHAALQFAGFRRHDGSDLV